MREQIETAMLSKKIVTGDNEEACKSATGHS